MVEKAEDSAWLTTTDIEQVSEELHYLKQFDQATSTYYGLYLNVPFPIVDNDNNTNNNNKSLNQKSTQAYKLFSKGKKPVEVAIQLGLSERQATRYYREYWELKGLHELTFLYEERKDYLPSFIRLHNIMQRQGMDDENDIANVLK